MKYKIKVTQTRELEGWYEADSPELAVHEAEREVNVMGEIVIRESVVMATEYSRRGQ